MGAGLVSRCRLHDAQAVSATKRQVCDGRRHDQRKFRQQIDGVQLVASGGGTDDLAQKVNALGLKRVHQPDAAPR